METTRRLLLADLNELTDSVVKPLYSEDTDQFSPLGWLAHKAGAEKGWLDKRFLLCMVTSVGKNWQAQYDISGSTLWRLEHHIQKAVYDSDEDTPKERAVQAIKDFNRWN